jgi:hypothetical protein
LRAPSTADEASGSDRMLAAIAHVSGRQRATCAEISCFKFDALVLGIRSRPGGKVAGLPGMIEHHRVADTPPTAMLDVVEGPDPKLEALLPGRLNVDDRFVSSTAAIYCLWEPWSGGKLTIVDRTTCRGFVWHRSPAPLPSWEIARPFLHVFKALSTVTGLMPVHAAAVARGDRGILIAGRGGAGKTSIALACLEAGWRYLGDDFLLIAASPLRGVNLYRSARVREDMFERLPRSMSAIIALSIDSGEVKGEVDVGRLTSTVICDAPIHAIVSPKRAGASSVALEPIRKSAALRELAATTLAMLPGDASGACDFIARSIQETPCYSVDPGPILASVPAALETLTDPSVMPCARV